MNDGGVHRLRVMLFGGAVDRCLPAVEGASGVASWVPWVPWAVWWAVGIG